jgi:hypothetical protein
MRKPSFRTILLFSTVFVYSAAARSDSTDFYEQLRKTNDFDPAKVNELKKKTVDADRINQVNQESADIVNANKKSEKEVDGGLVSTDEISPAIPAAKTSTSSRQKNPFASGINETTAPPLKVNLADFPEDIDFTSPAAPAIPKNLPPSAKTSASAPSTPTMPSK